MLGKITLLLLFLLLIWGNVVAGLGAGLACPDWPLCYGKFIPPLRWDIVLEKGHRILGAITGFVLIALCVIRFKSYKGWFKSVPILAVLLLAVQIPLGGVVVLLKIPVNITTLHFAIAMLILSFALYLAFFDGAEKQAVLSINGLSGALFLFAFIVLLQTVVGAYVRHSGSGLACGADFPLCLGFVVPPNLSGTVLIHYLHRSIGYLIVLFGIIYSVMSFTNESMRPHKNAILSVMLLIMVQIAMGAGIVHTKLHVITTALHLLIALLILSFLANVWFHEMNKRWV